MPGTFFSQQLSPYTPPVPNYTPLGQTLVSTPAPGLLPDPSLGALPATDDQLGKNNYRQYDLDGRYETDNGLLIVPVGGPVGTPPVLMRMHAGYTTRNVAWTIERMGAKPVLPSVSTGNSNEILAYRSVTVAAPLLGTNNQVYRASGLYTYYEAATLLGDSPAATGGVPFSLMSTPSDNLYSSGSFQANIITG